MAKIDLKSLQKQYASMFSGWFQSFEQAFNISDIPLTEYASMQKDETVSSALDLLVGYVRNKIGQYTHEDPSITIFVNTNFEQLDEGFIQILNKLLRNLYTYGYAVGEMVFAPFQGKLVLKKIIVLDSLNVSWVLDENYEIKAVRYKSMFDTVDIPIWKCIVLQRNIGQDGYGESLLRSAYRAWKFKEMLFKYWALAMERYAAPILLGKTAGEPEAMANVLKDVWRNGVIAVYETDQVDVLEPSHNVGETFKSAIEYANSLIYRALLIPSMLLRVEDVGTYALAKVHLQVFERFVTEEAMQVADAILDQVVAKILELNYGQLDSYGRFLMKDSSDIENMKMLAEIYRTLIDVGVLDAIADNDYIRTTLGIPKSE